MIEILTWFKKKKWLLLGLLLCYLIFQMMFSFLQGSERYFSFFFLLVDIIILYFIIPDSKSFRFAKYLVLTILFIPLSTIYLIGLIFPLLEALIICIVAIAIISQLSYLIFTLLPNVITGQELSLPTIIYLTITLSIVLLYFLGGSLVNLIWFAIYLHKVYKKEFKVQLAKNKLLLKDIADIKRMRFLLYTSFFIFLIIYSLQTINETNWLLPAEIHQSIFYSFVTFIAFDRIIGNVHLMKINLNQLIYTLAKFNRPGINEEEKYYRLKKRERNKNRNT